MTSCCREATAARYLSASAVVATRSASRRCPKRVDSRAKRLARRLRAHQGRPGALRSRPRAPACRRARRGHGSSLPRRSLPAREPSVSAQAYSPPVLRLLQEWAADPVRCGPSIDCRPSTSAATSLKDPGTNQQQSPRRNAMGSTSTVLVRSSSSTPRRTSCEPSYRHCAWRVSTLSELRVEVACALCGLRAR